MKKTLIAFAIAFFLAIGVSSAYIVFTSELARFFASLDTSSENFSLHNAILALFGFSVGPVLSFVVFYFSAARTEIRASRRTTFSMFLGSLTGSLSFVLFGSTVLATSTMNAYSILGYAITFCSLVGVSLCFFPALIAVLYAELKGNKVSLT